MKVAIAPGVWRDDGPQAAVIRHPNYTSVAASPVGSMIVPPSSTPLPVTAAEMARRRRKAITRKSVNKATSTNERRFSIHPENRW